MRISDQQQQARVQRVRGFQVTSWMGQAVFTSVYKLVCSFKMWDTCASDHAALSTEFRVNVEGGESANTKHHVCQQPGFALAA
jgi:hypothetical protein